MKISDFDNGSVAGVADVADNRGVGETSPGVAVLDDLDDFIRRFIVYPNDHCFTASVLWIAHTHLLDHFDTTPRLAVLSPEPGSGKTRVQEVLELVVPDPMATFNVSAAVLYRSMAEDDDGNMRRPTVLLDEADTIFGPRASKDHEDLRGFINSGYRRGAMAQRCAMYGRKVVIETFPSFAAVCIAGLDDLPDTIMTRSVVIRMQRRAPGEQVESFRRRLIEPVGHLLREQISTWASTLNLSESFPDLPVGVEDRNADCWEPLVAIADAAGGDWSHRARQAASHFVEVGKDNSQSLNLRLLADLRTVFNNHPKDDRLHIPLGGIEHMSTVDILAALVALDESPWSDLRGGHPLDARGLSRRLHKYQVKPAQIRIGDKNLRGYRREDLHDVWNRYLPPVVSPSPETSATSATSATNDQVVPDELPF